MSTSRLSLSIFRHTEQRGSDANGSTLTLYFFAEGTHHPFRQRQTLFDGRTQSLSSTPHLQSKGYDPARRTTK